MRKQTVVAILDADGTRHTVTQERHPARSYGRGFVILFTDAMKATARHIKSGITLRVMIVLPDYLNFTDFRRLRTVDLAAELETDSGNISRAMKELLQLGIVEREGKGPVTAWRLSSDWGWNGTADQYHAFRGGRMKGKRPPKGKATSRITHTTGVDATSTSDPQQKGNIKQSRLTLLAPLPSKEAS